MSRSISPETRAGIERALNKAIRLAYAAKRENLSDWAERHFELDADSSHKVGAWKCWAFQRGLMDWMSDDRIIRVIVRKSKRVGYTKILTALICYYAEHLRRKVALWQPTEGDRDSYAKTELEPVLDVIKVVREARRQAGKLDTLKLKQFMGALVHLLGGNAARAYRRITVALSILDEWSAFDQDIEGRGDPGSLAFGRLEGAPHPKFVGGSTPGTRGACHVTLAADQADVDMRYHVECPHCGVEHPLTNGMDHKVRGKRTRHGLQWEPGKPETAVHICPHCLQPMTQAQYLAGGEPVSGVWVCIRTGLRYLGESIWVDVLGNEVRPPKNVAAQVWSIYSPQRTWASIAEDHEKARAAEEAGDSSLMISLINETYGDAYEVQGEQQDDNALSGRAENYRMGSVPIGALVLTAGIDVQNDRVEIGVWGWAKGMESWPVDHHIIEGNPAADDRMWVDVFAYLRRRYEQQWNGGTLGIESISIDSGYSTHAVYAAVRNAGPGLNIRAVKGQDDQKKPIKMAATVQDVNWRGIRTPGGIRLWGIGTPASEDLLHGQLSLASPGPGYIHFSSDLPTEWYAQLTGKRRVPVRSGIAIIQRWIRTRPRVEVRDCRRYAHHAALCLGLDTYSADRWAAIEAVVQPAADLFAIPRDDGPPIVSSAIVVNPTDARPPAAPLHHAAHDDLNHIPSRWS